MNQRNFYAGIFAFIMIFILSCKPNVENEIKNYAMNVETVTKKIARYPQFKAILEKFLADAKAKWDAGNAISGGEEKAKALKAVNEMFIDNPVARGLGSYEGHIDNVRKLQKELAAVNDRQYAYTISRALVDGDRAVAEARDIVFKSVPKDEADGAEIIKNANGVLISKEGDLNRLKKAVTPKTETPAPVKKK